MTQPTLATLFERGVLIPNDVLVINKQKLRTKTPVTEAMLQTQDDPEFWQCRITEDTRETHHVRYIYDDEHYRLAPLATHIVEALVENPSRVHITSQELYWRHTGFKNRTLWNLAINRVESERRTRDVE